MTTVPDTDRIYTTLYTTFDEGRGLQKTVVITGQAGKRIVLEKLTLELGVASAGAEGTAIIKGGINGIEETFATFTETDTEYTLKTQQLEYVVGDGADLILKWYLKTDTVGVKSKMRYLEYTYSYRDIVLPDPISCLMIPCKSEEEARSIREKIKGVAKTILVYLKCE